MKKIIYLILVVILTGCGYSSPKINDSERPFVVYEIRSTKGYYVKYISRCQNTELLTLESRKTCVIAPIGMYNIGDTIQFNLIKD
jgi:hypothetical protein